MTTNNETKKPNQELKSTAFIHLKDLKETDAKEHFIVKPATLSRTTTKTGRLMTSIRIKLFNDILTALTIMPSGKFLSPDKFELILMARQLELKDHDGRIKSEWNIPVYVRFVKGQYEDGNEFKALEILYKQKVYDTHFFSYDQSRLLDLVDSSIKWSKYPKKIATLESSDIELLEPEF